MPSARVLIVEDERHIKLTLKLYLQSRGFEVETAGNGEEGLELFLAEKQSGRQFDLVVTDVVMPVMYGPEMVEWMRSEGYEGQVIAITGYGDEESFARLKKAGCFRIIEKPFSPLRIESVITEALAAGRRYEESGDGKCTIG